LIASLFMASPTGRTLVFPDVSPEGLQPPRPAYYLSWPAWEAFRVQRLGQAPPAEDLAPLLTDEPPNFAASLSALMTAAEDGPRPVERTGLGRTASDRPEESESAIKAALLGRAARPPEGSGDHLKLALWAVEKSLSREASSFLTRAAEKNRELFQRLRHELPPGPLADAAGDRLAEPSADLWAADRPFEPSLPTATVRGLRRAWLRLAGPGLTPDDRLWPSRPEFKPATDDAELVELPPGSGLYAWRPAGRREARP
jgi:hypothetical protein